MPDRGCPYLHGGRGAAAGSRATGLCAAGRNPGLGRGSQPAQCRGHRRGRCGVAGCRYRSGYRALCRQAYLSLRHRHRAQASPGNPEQGPGRRQGTERRCGVNRCRWQRENRGLQTPAHGRFVHVADGGGWRVVDRLVLCLWHQCVSGTGHLAGGLDADRW
ncbi:hypothetical protein D3C76_1237190 [compost metagenome]